MNTIWIDSVLNSNSNRNYVHKHVVEHAVTIDIQY